MKRKERIEGRSKRKRRITGKDRKVGKEWRGRDRNTRKRDYRG